MKKFIYLFLILLFISCSTSKQVSVLKHMTPTTGEVKVLGVGQTIPENAELLGSIKIGDSGFTTKCSYSEVITDATNQAKSMGGNYILIIKHKEPDFWSTCHRLTCEVYLVK